MGREDVWHALERMDDEAVRGRVEAGDLSDLDDLALDDAERQMVQSAAGDYPEVVGFAFSTFGSMDFGGVKGVFKFYKLDPNATQKIGLQPNSVIEGVFKYAMGDGSV